MVTGWLSGVLEPMRLAFCHLSERGVTYVPDQAMRIMLHGRITYGMERYRREHADVDIVLIELTGDDLRMFTYKLMRYSARKVVAEHGYLSTLAFFDKDRRRLARRLSRHGMRLRDPGRGPGRPDAHPDRSVLARSLDASLDRLHSRLAPSQSTRRR